MRCIQCMKEIEDGAQVCSHCNFEQDTPQTHPEALAPGTRLRNRFLVGKELGRGGFGISYVGYDEYLDCRVAIKEYCPQMMASRMPGEAKVCWTNNKTRDDGCQNVIREARKMNKLGALPAAVHVLDVIYENNTVYIAMDYVEGVTLKQYLLKHGVLSAEKCIEMMLPVLDTMSEMHEAGIIHRDISPDNIMLQSKDGKPRILDLGAAKDTKTESGYTILVARNGFSPMEQYRSKGDIGTWTDVYALCATMYYSLIGKVPPYAMDRSETDDDLPFDTVHQLPEKLRQVLRDGMRMCIDKRIPTVEELKHRLESSLLPDIPVSQNPPVAPPVVQEPIVESAAYPQLPSLEKPREEKPKGFSWLWKWGKKKPDQLNQPTAERRPVSLTIAQPDAPPVYEDPNATVLSSMDGDETVLNDEVRPVCARGWLVQKRTGKRIEISKCCFVLGRATHVAPANKQLLADFLIEDSTKHISRRHVAILFNGENFYLQDVSGKNITLLNDVRIQNGIMPDGGGWFPMAYPLYDGDRIQLAEERFTFRKGDVR